MAFSRVRPERVRGLAIGFILLAVILIAAIGIAIAVGARGKTSSLEESSALASAIVQQGVNIRLAVDRMVGDGVVKTAAFITLDTDAHTGLYNPAFGYLPQQLPPAAAFTGSSAPSQWQLISRTSGSYPSIYAYGALSIGGMTLSSTYVILPYLTRSVCGAINYALYSQSIRHTWAPAYRSYLPLSTWQNGMGTNLPGLEACVYTSDTPPVYLYYKVVEDYSPAMWGP